MALEVGGPTLAKQGGFKRNNSPINVYVFELVLPYKMGLVSIAEQIN